MFRLPWQRVWEALRADSFYGDATVFRQCLIESAEVLGECVRFLIVREVVAEIRPTRWDGKSVVGVVLDRDSCGMKQLPLSIEHHLANFQDYVAENKKLPYEQLIEFDGEVISIRDAILKYRTPNSHVQLLFLWNLNGLPVYFEDKMQPATTIESVSPFPEFKRFVSPLAPLLYVDKDDLARYLSSRNMPLPSALFPEEIGTQHFFNSVNDPSNIWKPILELNGARQFLASQSAKNDTGGTPGDSPFPVAGGQEAAVVEATSSHISTNKELELDIEECREIARLIWSRDPEKRIDPVAKEIASDTHVVGQPCKWMDGRKSASAVRKWIKDLCPAPRSGRPRKNP